MPDDACEPGQWEAVFHLAGDGIVHLHIRMSHGGLVGIGSAQVRAGEDYAGISFEEMAARRLGSLIVQDGKLVIERPGDEGDRENAPPADVGDRQ